MTGRGLGVGRLRAGGWPLGRRLFLAQALVVIAAILTAAAVAAVVGPPLFHTHLIQTGHSADSPELVHIERAYLDASTTSLLVALVVATCCALSVTWYLTRRIKQPLDTLTQAAARLSAGHYDTRVPDTDAGAEIDTLSEAFNHMAGKLEGIEDNRRRLLSDLAHELRTPLATISAHLEALSDGVADWNGSTARVLTEQTERLTRLVVDINDVSRAEEGRIALDLGPCVASDLVTRAVEQVQTAYLAKGVALAESLGPHVTLMADPQRIGQVLTNLLSNALRHTPSGGRVTVSASAKGNQCEITVTDTGEGMTPDQLSHIFERFYRGDTARDRDAGGSGIGLTIAKALAETHGGSLTASSEGPGRGSSFVLTLPAAA
ncbi:MAG: HAMP domain-containing sensor histidine kinase [Micropruina sp.]